MKFCGKHANNGMVDLRHRDHKPTALRRASVQEASVQEESSGVQQEQLCPRSAGVGRITSCRERVKGLFTGPGREGGGELVRPTAAGSIMGYAPVAGLGTLRGGERESASRLAVAGSIMGYAEPVARLGTDRRGAGNATRPAHVGAFMAR
eukprot:g6706.t1